MTEDSRGDECRGGLISPTKLVKMANTSRFRQSLPPPCPKMPLQIGHKSRDLPRHEFGRREHGVNFLLWQHMVFQHFNYLPAGE